MPVASCEEDEKRTRSSMQEMVYAIPKLPCDQHGKGSGEHRLFLLVHGHAQGLHRTVQRIGIACPNC